MAFDSLGNQFSIIEQTVFLATLMQHFKVTLSSFKTPLNAGAINTVQELKINLTKW